MKIPCFPLCEILIFYYPKSLRLARWAIKMQLGLSASEGEISTHARALADEQIESRRCVYLREWSPRVQYDSHCYIPTARLYHIQPNCNSSLQHKKKYISMPHRSPLRLHFLSTGICTRMFYVCRRIHLINRKWILRPHQKIYTSREKIGISHAI
jgi:hypothetical protein